MVFQHDLILIVKYIVLDKAMHARGGGNGEGAAGRGDKAVPGDYVDGVLRGTGGGAGAHPQVLSQVHPGGVEAAGTQLAAGVNGAGAGAGDEEHPRVGVGGGGRRGTYVVLPPLVHRAPAGVHEEIRDCRGVQAELAGDRNLHFFRRSLGFLKEDENWLDGRNLAGTGGGGLEQWTETEIVIAFRTGL